MGVEVLYTNTDAIRGVLGLSAKDLSDEDITNANTAMRLLDRLERWLADHAAVQAAGTVAEPAAADERAWRRLQLYCQYEAAVLMCAALQYAAVQRIGDGTADMQRFTSRWQDLREQMEIGAREYQILLAEDLEIPLDSVDYDFLGISVPATDPVTGS